MPNLEIYEIVFALLAIVVAISLHEMMHAFTSHVLGDDTAHLHGRMTVNPLAHIDIFTTVLLPLMLLMLGAPPVGAARPVPFNPHKLRFGEYGAAIVAIAGPLTNLVLAVIGGLLLGLLSPDSMVINNALLIFVAVNIGFFVFNMLPIPPLDGSRVVYVFAPDWLRSIMRAIENMGIIIIIFLLILILPLLSPLLITVNTGILDLLTGA